MRVVSAPLREGWNQLQVQGPPRPLDVLDTVTGEVRAYFAETGAPSVVSMLFVSYGGDNVPSTVLPEHHVKSIRTPSGPCHVFFVRSVEVPL